MLINIKIKRQFHIIFALNLNFYGLAHPPMISVLLRPVFLSNSHFFQSPSLEELSQNFIVNFCCCGLIQVNDCIKWTHATFCDF